MEVPWPLAEVPWPLLLIVYGLSIPLWLPPVVIALRNGDEDDWRKYWSVVLAVLSPLVATVTIFGVSTYCAAGEPEYMYDFFPNCPSGAPLIALIPPTITGVLAWVMALTARGAETAQSRRTSRTDSRIEDQHG